MGASAAAGIALSAGHPPLGLWTAAPLGVALLTTVTYRRRIGAGALTGAIAGAAYFTLMTHWVGVFGTDALIALVLIGTTWFAIMGAALALVSRLPLWPLAAAATWSLQEILFARAPFGGFPWGRLAYSQIDSPGVALVSLTAATGLSFLVALSGSLIAYCLITASNSTTLVTKAAAGIGALFSLLVPLLGALVPLETEGQTINGPAQARIAVVQGGPHNSTIGVFDAAQKQLRAYSALTKQLGEEVNRDADKKVDLIIWPENSANMDPLNNAEARSLVTEAVNSAGVPTLVGVITRNKENGTIDNRAVLWNPVTEEGPYYIKNRPVPFGEYLPGREAFETVARYWPWLGNRFAWLETDFTSGEGAGVLNSDNLTLGIGICFEVAYDTIMRTATQEGSRILVIPTNNSLWAGSAGVEQQFTMARLRAIEHSRTVVTAATTGISAVVAPDGHVTHILAEDKPGIITTDVALRDTQTLAVLHGGHIELALALLGAGTLALAAGQRWRNRQNARSEKNHRTR